MLLRRGLALAFAIVACAWFAIGIRQTRNLERATSIIDATSSLTARQATQVNSLLDAASWLNPGQEANVARGQTATLADDPSSALRILTGVIHSEPMNLAGWVALAQAAIDHSRPLVDLAAQRIAGLDPRLK